MDYSLSDWDKAETGYKSAKTDYDKAFDSYGSAALNWEYATGCMAECEKYVKLNE